MPIREVSCRGQTYYIGKDVARALGQNAPSFYRLCRRNGVEEIGVAGHQLHFHSNREVLLFLKPQVDQLLLVRKGVLLQPPADLLTLSHAACLLLAQRSNIYSVLNTSSSSSSTSTVSPCTALTPSTPALACSPLLHS
jgi:hypothetical protein